MESVCDRADRIKTCYLEPDRPEPCEAAPVPSICFSIQVYPSDIRPGQGVEVFRVLCMKPSRKIRETARLRLAAHNLNWPSSDSQLAISCNCRTAFQMDGYLLSDFARTIQLSRVYAMLMFRTHFKNSTITILRPEHNSPDGELNFVVHVQLLPCARHYFDRLGSRILNSFLHERIELDDTLSWLSSLGGAFSALGDLSSSWAEQAGRITIHQLKIALRLGDPLIISRCHLYAAISLIQRGYYKSARKIIINEYNFAKSLPGGTDTRLVRMCLGIWSKLKYTASAHPSQDKVKKKRVQENGMNGVQTTVGMGDGTLVNTFFTTSDARIMTA